LILAKM